MALIRAAIDVAATAVADGAPRSLLRLAARPEDGARWENGVGFNAATCDPALAQPLACDPLEGYDKTPGEPAPLSVFDPVVLVGVDQCSTLDQGRDRVGRARQQLLATQSWQLERELWDGVVTRGAGYPNRYLAQWDSDAAAPVAEDLGAGDPVAAMAALDQYLADCLHGQPGMIHATPTTFAYWQAAGVVVRSADGTATSPAGHPIVAGAGYSGSAAGADGPVPPADLPTEADAYATGPVAVRLGPIVEPTGEQAAAQINRANNDWTVIVERTALVYFGPCCLGAVTVTHST